MFKHYRPGDDGTLLVLLLGYRYRYRLYQSIGGIGGIGGIDGIGGTRVSEYAIEKGSMVTEVSLVSDRKSVV